MSSSAEDINGKPPAFRGLPFDPSKVLPLCEGQQHRISSTAWSSFQEKGQLIVVALIGGTYLAYVKKRYWIVAVVLDCVSVPILYDWNRRIKIRQTLNRQT
jgi:hypothetical protein